MRAPVLHHRRPRAGARAYGPLPSRIDRTGTLSRYARPSVLLQQTDAASGFRYHRADGYCLEVSGEDVVITPAAGVKLQCRER